MTQNKEHIEKQSIPAARLQYTVDLFAIFAEYQEWTSAVAKPTSAQVLCPMTPLAVKACAKQRVISQTNHKLVFGYAKPWDTGIPWVADS